MWYNQMVKITTMNIEPKLPEQISNQETQFEEAHIGLTILLEKYLKQENEGERDIKAELYKIYSNLNCTKQALLISYAKDLVELLNSHNCNNSQLVIDELYNLVAKQNAIIHDEPLVA